MKLKRPIKALAIVALAAVFMLLNNGCKKANDTTPPIILLKGANPYYLNLKSAYIEYGAIANDNVDGEVSNQIVITGVSAINTTSKGIFSVNYSITDAAGNSYHTTRKVVVINSADSLAGNYRVHDTCMATDSSSFNSRISTSNTVDGMFKIYDFILAGDSIVGSLTSDTTITFVPNQYLGGGDSLINAYGVVSFVDTAFNGSAPIRNLTIYYKWYNGIGTDSCIAKYFHQ